MSKVAYWSMWRTPIDNILISLLNVTKSTGIEKPASQLHSALVKLLGSQPFDQQAQNQ